MDASSTSLLMELRESVAVQETPAQRVAVVGNRAPLPLPPDGVTGVESPENLIVAGGRNAALARLAESGDIDVVVDLDDDGLPISPEAFTRLAGLYDRDERLGVVSFRICDERVSPSGEEIDLAWRALDAGWKVLYEPPTLVLQASVTSPTRHAVFHRMGRPEPGMAGRPSAICPPRWFPPTLGAWTLLTPARIRSWGGLRAWFAGFAEGVRTACPPRRPMRWWATVRRTTPPRPPPVLWTPTACSLRSQSGTAPGVLPSHRT